MISSAYFPNKVLRLIFPSRSFSKENVFLTVICSLISFPI